MPSLSLSAFRACAAVGLGAVVTVGVWAGPTQSSSAPAPETSGHVAAPAVEIPEVGAGTAERSVDPQSADATPSAPTTEVAPVAADDPSPTPEVVTPAQPDHLAPVADDTPAPAAVVTTTTTVAPPTTTKAPSAPAATVAFTASQKYGSCGEAVPYDVFSGTANPGSTITISSSYGSGSTVADGNGHWSTTVEFPAAPRGETFTVTASGAGGSKTFSFTATGEAHA